VNSLKDTGGSCVCMCVYEFPGTSIDRNLWCGWLHVLVLQTRTTQVYAVIERRDLRSSTKHKMWDADLRYGGCKGGLQDR